MSLPTVTRSGTVRGLSGGFHIISGDDWTPWAVTSGPRGWYVTDRRTGKAEFVGPVRTRGHNYCDQARELARRRNSEHNEGSN